MNVDIENARAGMVLADDIVSNKIRILKKGAVLNDKMLAALRNRNINQISIVDAEKEKSRHLAQDKLIEDRFQEFEHSVVMMKLKDIVIQAAGESHE